MCKPKRVLCVAVEMAEPGADLISVGVVQIVKDGQGLPQVLTGRRQVPAGVVHFAKVGQRDGLSVPVTEFASQPQAVLIAGDGFGVVAEVLVGVGEAVAGDGRAEIVT